MDIPDTRQRVLLRVNKKHGKTIRPSRSGLVDNARIILWDDLSTTIFDRSSYLRLDMETLAR